MLKVKSLEISADTNHMIIINVRIAPLSSILATRTPMNGAAGYLAPRHLFVLF